MATWLTIVNDLQARLREDQTATVTATNYSTMLGALVNQAKAYVEDSWDWHCLRTILSFNTVNGTATYSITGSNERSRFFTPNRDVYDDTNDAILYPVPDSYIDSSTYIGTTQSGNPSYYRIRGVSGGELQITLYPTPSGVSTIRVPMVVPQSALTGTTTITVPYIPVLEFAYAYALRERGEDGGGQYAEALNHAQNVLTKAIMMDMEFSPDESYASLA